MGQNQKFGADAIPACQLALLRADSNNTSIRKSERKHTEIIASVVTEDGRETICTIRDVSQAGAGISLTPTFLLPKRFVLQFAEGTKAFNVELIWRRGNSAGVKIVAPRRQQKSGPEVFRI